MEHDLYKNLGDIDMCREFDMFKVKVYIIFFGTVGFSLHREGRYTFSSDSGRWPIQLAFPFWDVACYALHGF